LKKKLMTLWEELTNTTYHYQRCSNFRPNWPVLYPSITICIQNFNIVFHSRVYLTWSNFKWNSREFRTHAWNSQEFRGIPGNSAVFLGIPRYSLEFHGIPWNSTVFLGISMKFLGIQCNFKEYFLEFPVFSGILRYSWEFRGIPGNSAIFPGIPK